MEHDALACHPERVTPSPDLAVERHEGAGEPPLGRFVYDKIRDEDGRTVLCEVVVFGLKVKRRLKSGLEAGSGSCVGSRLQTPKRSPVRKVCVLLILALADQKSPE